MGLRSSPQSRSVTLQSMWSCVEAIIGYWLTRTSETTSPIQMPPPSWVDVPQSSPFPGPSQNSLSSKSDSVDSPSIRVSSFGAVAPPLLDLDLDLSGRARDIDEMRQNLPQNSALDTLVGRILAADWLHRDKEEPKYSRLTAALVDDLPLAIKPKDGQSIFLAFRDEKHKCVFCAHCEPKPKRMVPHIRAHFGLRPYECQISDCVLCTDR